MLIKIRTRDDGCQKFHFKSFLFLTILSKIESIVWAVKIPFFVTLVVNQKGKWSQKVNSSIVSKVLLCNLLAYIDKKNFTSDKNYDAIVSRKVCSLSDDLLPTSLSLH